MKALKIEHRKVYKLGKINKKNRNLNNFIIKNDICKMVLTLYGG
jgi:hypothetical protein